jgi:hypothetical protein
MVALLLRLKSGLPHNTNSVVLPDAIKGTVNSFRHVGHTTFLPAVSSRVRSWPSQCGQWKVISTPPPSFPSNLVLLMASPFSGVSGYWDSVLRCNSLLDARNWGNPQRVPIWQSLQPNVRPLRCTNPSCDRLLLRAVAESFRFWRKCDSLQLSPAPLQSSDNHRNNDSTNHTQERRIDSSSSREQHYHEDAENQRKRNQTTQ